MVRRITSTVALASALSIATSAGAMLITTDEAWFDAHYTSPTQTVNFTMLRDGTTFDNAFYSNSFYIRQANGGASGKSYVLRPEAWSGYFNIASTGNCGQLSGVDATTWTGPGLIAPTGCTGLYIEFLASNGPIALTTSAGFVGLIPESIADSYYMPTGRLLEVQRGFREVVIEPPPPPPTPVSAPATLLLVAVTLGSLALSRRQRLV